MNINKPELSDIQKYSEEETILLQNEPKETPFWYEDINIILNNEFISEIYPTDGMDYNRMLNSVTRAVILLTLIVFVLSPSYRVLGLFIFTIGIIFLMHHYKNKQKESEGFNGPAKDYLENSGLEIPTDGVFSTPNSTNPFSNVLMTDYATNPDKLPAPPAYNENVQEKIKEAAKAAVQEANPDHPGLAEKVFKDLGDELNLEQSLRQFNSAPSTTIPNDQEAFAQFCYGSMVSCKEGNAFACARNLSRHTNY
tara:strand:- start:498 stop:1256 length:759 start_codon:yes stop_codon:yes gene_type:complete